MDQRSMTMVIFITTTEVRKCFLFFLIWAPVIRLIIPQMRK